MRNLKIKNMIESLESFALNTILAYERLPYLTNSSMTSI